MDVFGFNLSKEQLYIIIGLIVFMLFGLGIAVYNRLTPPKDADILSEVSKPVQSCVMAHISGAINREGVYELKYGDRVLDLIKLAGGVKANADLDSINLAEIVKDGQKLCVPYREYQNTRLSDGRISEDQSIRKKININTASLEELDELPGVGPSMAKKIMEARPFRKIEDITKIPRFGKSKFEKIKSRIRV